MKIAVMLTLLKNKMVVI